MQSGALRLTEDGAQAASRSARQPDADELRDDGLGWVDLDAELPAPHGE